MSTDSEMLMHEGVAAARETFGEFLDETAWTAADIQKTFCHQVGRAHQRLLFEALGLDPRIDYSTLEYLGNTGSVALPVTAAIGIERGHLQPDDRVALLGIGSGINVIMLGLQWQGYTPAQSAAGSTHTEVITSTSEQPLSPELAVLLVSL